MIVRGSWTSNLKPQPVNLEIEILTFHNRVFRFLGTGAGDHETTVRRLLLHPPIHPGGNPGANFKSISHSCYLREVAFEWELTKKTICFPLICFQGGNQLSLPHAECGGLDAGGSAVPPVVERVSFHRIKPWSRAVRALTSRLNFLVGVKWSCMRINELLSPLPLVGGTLGAAGAGGAGGDGAGAEGSTTKTTLTKSFTTETAEERSKVSRALACLGCKRPLPIS